MKQILNRIIVTLLLLLIAQPCQAVETGGITVLVSSRLKPYMQALQGFREVCGDIQAVPAIKTIQSCPIKEIILSEHPGLSPESLAAKIKEDTPRVLIAIGSNALEMLKLTNDIPVVFLLVPDSETLLNGRSNATGINMLLPVENEIEALLAVMPSVKRIGIVYSNKYSKNRLRNLENQVRKKGLNLLSREADTPQNAPKLIAGMAGVIDVLWMPPDPDLLTPDVIEYMLLFSQGNLLPIVTFSEKFLKSGAAIAITFDAKDTGRQAAVLAKRIYEKASAAGLPVEPPQKARLLYNPTVVKKLGLSINHDVISKEE